MQAELSLLGARVLINLFNFPLYLCGSVKYLEEVHYSHISLLMHFEHFSYSLFRFYLEYVREFQGFINSGMETFSAIRKLYLEV
eukprot:snap_masked-scaffold_8-processed-gene-6.17-mRNA-1 protein AED:1.00 eAED:1.00 QI:0/0/0/0/1/1/3/0/83